MIGSLARKIFGSANDRYVKRQYKIVEQINSLEPSIAPLSDEQLRAKTDEFRTRLKQGETLDDLLPEAFAVVREAAKRTLGQRHYDVQMIGGIVLHRGQIAEMKTGEGKTLVATLAAYLNALEGKGVHIVTVNDYLAKRDAEWMGQVYRFLGRTVDSIVHEKNDDERRRICSEALESGGLKPAEDIMSRYPHELSGGQLQRISIIRSMFFKPDLIIADEPVSMLDVSVRADIINMLLDLAKKNNTAVIFISHDIALTRYISDHIAVMYLGRVVEYGETDDVIAHPRHPYTRVLISHCADVDPDQVRDSLPITGEPPTPINPGPGCYFEPRCFKACPGCKNAYPGRVELGNGHYAYCSCAQED